MGKIKKYCREIAHNSFAVTVIMAISVNLFIELMARHSLIAAFKFMVTSPLIFLFNSLIIFTTYSLALVIKRRLFWYSLISFIWLFLGVANGVILLKRMTPLTVADFSVMKDGISILTQYLSKTTIILVIVILIFVIIAFSVLFIKGPKRIGRIKYKRNVLVFLCILLTMFGGAKLAIKTNVVGTYFVNLAYAYRDYGVPYSFISSWVSKGINRPDGYSREKILSIIDKDQLNKDGVYKPSDKIKNSARRPNIIFVQLESFLDPKVIKGYKYSKDPCPNFRKFKKEYSSGLFEVPAVGAGTANTEFEAITGFSARFFGPGEYPYKEVLQEEPCESIPYDLKEIGYSACAIHNHRGAFYGRNVAFSNLGFDTFASIEYMNNPVTTPRNWAKDSILPEQIMTALKSTKNEDYIYTISVQGHGQYPTEKALDNPVIKVEKAPTQELKWQVEYYANQVYEMDKFVKSLTDMLSDFDEETVVVFYGDHIPPLDIREEQLGRRSLFDTDYIIWNNFGMKKENGKLCAYQIGAEILDRLDIHTGMITNYTQNHKNDKDYNKNLKALAYDILYGKRYIYGGINPFKKSDLKMGLKDIKIKDIVKVGSKYYIKGQNFTEYSKVYLDGEILETTYMGPTMLECKEKVDRKDIKKIKISQVEKYNEILSTTE